MTTKSTTSKARVKAAAVEGAERLRGLIDGDSFVVDAATTPPLHEVGALPIRYVRLGAKVKRAPGLIELLETTRTVTSLQIHSADVLERPPRSTVVTSLFIEGAATKNLDFLRGFPALEELTVGGRQTSLASLSGIDACPKLRKLKVRQHLARTLKPLASLEKLDELCSPTAKNITSLDGVSQETLLHVDVNLTPILSLAPLARASGLLALKMRGAKVSSIAPILGCHRLQTLYAERSSLESIDGIGQSMPELRLLWIGDTKVKEIGGLAGLKTLLDLDLTGLKGVRDFGVLARLGALRSLNLYDTSFTDIGILESLPALAYVHLGRTAVSASDARVKKLHAILKKRDREGGVFFDPIRAPTRLSNADAAFCTTAWEEGAAYNCF
ncbi:MAG: hypothetical protein U0359_18605 [Byssovorax sp.]